MTTTLRSSTFTSAGSGGRRSHATLPRSARSTGRATATRMWRAPATTVDGRARVPSVERGDPVSSVTARFSRSRRRSMIAICRCPRLRAVDRAEYEDRIQPRLDVHAWRRRLQAVSAEHFAIVLGDLTPREELHRPFVGADGVLDV